MSNWNKDSTQKQQSIGDYFTENTGQISNDEIRFYSSGGIKVGFAESAVLLELEEHAEASPLNTFEEMMIGSYIQRDDALSERGVMVRVTFPESNKVMPQGVQEMPHRNNYFIGNNPSKWRTSVRNYMEIVYRDIYDGVDLVYKMQGGQLKYEFIVGPGADPALISVSYEGIEGIHIDSYGELVVSTALGELRDVEPISYQDEMIVECEFVKRKTLSFGFDCEDYNPALPLVIDPLVYSTFLGGSDWETVMSVDVDSVGNVYVTGSTSSIDFPTTLGAYNRTHSGSSDGYVTKLDSTGSYLVYSTYIGGDFADYPRAIAIDSIGHAYVAGHTWSKDFPVTSNAFDKVMTGRLDAFITKVNQNGSNIEYSSYLGGKSDDRIMSIAVNSLGNAYVTGETSSSDFLVTPGAFDITPSQNSDAFIAKIDTTGSYLVYSTFLGGSDGDSGQSLALDSVCNVFVTGMTWSADFPTTPSAYDRTLDGPWDSFITKLDQTGSFLMYSTYLGGSGFDEGLSIALDATDNAFVTGYLNSTDFPVTPDAFDTTPNGWYDPFVAKLDSTGGTLLYSTYLGGSSREWAKSVTVDSIGNIYVVGDTYSTDFLVTPDALDKDYGGNGFSDGFITKLDPTGRMLKYSTYLGGDDIDGATQVVVDNMDSIYVVGGTSSTDFPVTPGAFNTTPKEHGRYGFVMKMVWEYAINNPPVVNSFTATSAPEGSLIRFTVDADDSDNDSLTYSFDFESDGLFDVSGPSNTTAYVYSDDFNGMATVRVSDGNLSTEATAEVIVLNAPPTISDLNCTTKYHTAEARLRITGERWHDVRATLYRNDTEIGNATIVRYPASPNSQEVLLGTIDNIADYTATVLYTPDDDPINGQPNGATPIWIILRKDDGSEERFHHTSNARHPDTWVWDVKGLEDYLAGKKMTCTATATDPGMDDLTFEWDFGDGSPIVTSMYLNDGTYPFTASDVQTHTYMAGVYNLRVRVSDNDGGVTELVITVTIV